MTTTSISTGLRWDTGRSDPVTDIRCAMAANRAWPPQETVFWFGGAVHPQRAMLAVFRVEATEVSVEEASADPAAEKLLRTIERMVRQAGGNREPIHVTLVPKDEAAASVGLVEVGGYVLVRGQPPAGTALLCSTWRGRPLYTRAQRRRRARQDGRRFAARIPTHRPRQEAVVHASAGVPRDVQRAAALAAMSG